MELFDFEILRLIHEKGPIKARYIAYLLSQAKEDEITRRMVNSSIYSNLLQFVEQDNFFRWQVRPVVSQVFNEIQKVDLENDVGINYDSVVKIKYSTGQTKVFGFKGTGNNEVEKIDGVEYINYYAPLPQAVLGKKPGDVIKLNSKISIEILEVVES